MSPRLYGWVTSRTRSILERIPIRVVLVGTTAVVVAAALFGIVAVLRAPSPMTITARFATAPGLYPGNSVDVLGMPVGSVTRVTPAPPM
jgi:ABC-type transporter Mla subunit MlaD